MRISKTDCVGGRASDLWCNANLSEFYSPSPPLALFILSSHFPIARALAKETARRTIREEGTTTARILPDSSKRRKKSRFLVNYECHQFLSWSHCGRYSGMLPSLPPSIFPFGVERSAIQAHGKESKKGRETREREGHRGGGPAALLYPCLIPYPLVTSIPFGVPQEP